MREAYLRSLLCSDPQLSCLRRSGLCGAPSGAVQTAGVLRGLHSGEYYVYPPCHVGPIDEPVGIGFEFCWSDSFGHNHLSIANVLVVAGGRQVGRRGCDGGDEEVSFLDLSHLKAGCENDLRVRDSMSFENPGYPARPKGRQIHLYLSPSCTS